MKKLYFLTILLLNILGVQGAFATPSHWLPQNTTISGAFLWGPINGFVQIPAGGTDGTTSLRRPLFSEIGIHYSYNFDFNAALNWNHISLYGGYNYIRPHGKAILDEHMITHNTSIPAGTYLNSKLKFDYYSLGTKYNFYLCHNKLTLAPIIETNLMYFDYEIPNYIEPRTFSSAAFRVGVSWIYYFKPQFHLDTTIISSIPVCSLNIVTAETKLNYTFFANSPVSPTIFVGSKYTYINFQDQQVMPNHVYSSQVTVSSGLSIKFSF